MRLRYNIGCSAKWLYHTIPVPDKFKIAISHSIFAAFPFIFKHTQPYKDWIAAKTNSSAQTDIRPHQTVTFTPEEPTDWNEPDAVGSTADVTIGEELSTSSYSGGDPKQEYLKQLFQQAKGSKQYSPCYVPYEKSEIDTTQLLVKLIAFYLPQFHPFKENDEWWGKGFTEWTNVSKAVPQFLGHYQPHLPGELGFYDLRLPEIMHRQIELAKEYGIHGWCFHFYWFGGKRLLEKPLNQFLQSPTMGMPFCLCWANENWTRRWDGSEHEILMAQEHSPSDDIALIKEFEKSFRDPRYICIDGRPLLIVYRASILPDAVETTKRWREYCHSAGLGNPYLVAAQSFDVMDPTIYGFDAAVEFPPHQHHGKILNEDVVMLNPDYAGCVLDYQNLAEEYCTRSTQQPYTVFKTVSPGWDNEARKPGKGHSFHNFSLPKYSQWLERVSVTTLERSKPSENIVFINAWNEWGEGAHLEPDRKYGYGYLEATRRTISRVSSLPRSNRVLIVSHDAFPAGAQLLALNLSKEISQNFNIPVEIISLSGGDLLSDFERYATVHNLAGCDPEGIEAQCIVEKAFIHGARVAIVNTTASGKIVTTLRKLGFYIISLVHELPHTIKKNHLQVHAKILAAASDSVVFAANHVADCFTTCAPNLDPAKVRVRPQGTYKRNKFTQSQRETIRRRLRTQLQIPVSSPIVLGVGYGDHRKGVDLFVAAGLTVVSKCPNAHFVWVGNLESGSFEESILTTVTRSRYAGHFHFVGQKSDTDMYYIGADVLALTSREDPFPTVVLEALEVSVPVIGFEGAGGFTELLARGCGLTAPAFDTTFFASLLERVLTDSRLANELGLRGAEIVKKEFCFREYVSFLLSLPEKRKSVSVIVPNYNYAHYLGGRLDTILHQTYPIHELIVLDDCSTDGSVAVIEELQKWFPINIIVLKNEQNSGSVFRQWEKGVSVATGELVWIAEADDLSEPTFLEVVSRPFLDPEVVLSYCQSKQIDSDGYTTSNDYLLYTSDVSNEKWLYEYKEDGIKEVIEALSIKNTIPNVSAVVFRRDKLLKVITEGIELISNKRIAGDWLTYCLLLDQGKIAFNPQSLNLHRRHANSVTIGSACKQHLREVLEVQKFVREKHETSGAINLAAMEYAKRLYLQFGLSDDPFEMDNDQDFSIFLTSNCETKE